MKTRVPKVPLARTLALTAGLCAVSAVAFTGTGLAGVPAGSACAATAASPTNGKISGRGASFQTRAMAELIKGYNQDVCGNVAADAASGANMLVYNQSGVPNGSGQGLEAARCRTDAFSGTDIPYDQQDLGLINGPLLNPCQTNTYAGPYGPSPGPFPDPADTQGRAMSFPVAGSSASIVVHLDPGGACPNRTSATEAINLTVADLSGLAGGDIATWGDARLVADNPSLSGCTVPVTRVVRFDKSGTTQIFKNYLKNADPDRTVGPPKTCDVNNSWTTLALDANNASWPGAPQIPGPPTTSNPQPATADCSALTNGGQNGNNPMITKVRSTNGGFAYPDLADGIQTGTPALTLASVRNATDTAFVKPNKSFTNAANCDFAVSAPGSSDSDAVGLNGSGDNWGTDSTVNHSDPTFKGSLYPICGLTFDLVYTGLSNSAGSPIDGLSDNQRRTLYSFMLYVLSPLAQDRLAATNIYYAPVPANVLPKLRRGFKGNF